MKNLRQRVNTLLNSHDYQPLNKSEFARALKLKPNERSALRAELLRLENKGDIIRGKKGRFSTRKQSKNNSNLAKLGQNKRPSGQNKRPSGSGACSSEPSASSPPATHGSIQTPMTHPTKPPAST